MVPGGAANRRAGVSIADEGIGPARKRRSSPTRADMGIGPSPTRRRKTSSERNIGAALVHAHDKTALSTVPRPLTVLDPPHFPSCTHGAARIETRRFPHLAQFGRNDGRPGPAICIQTLRPAVFAASWGVAGDTDGWRHQGTAPPAPSRLGPGHLCLTLAATQCYCQNRQIHASVSGLEQARTCFSRQRQCCR